MAKRLCPCAAAAPHLISYLCRGAARTHLIMSVAGARMYCLRIESRARFAPPHSRTFPRNARWYQFLILLHAS